MRACLPTAPPQQRGRMPARPPAAAGDTLSSPLGGSPAAVPEGIGSSLPRECAADSHLSVELQKSNQPPVLDSEPGCVGQG